MLAEGFEMNAVVASALMHACGMSGNLEMLRKVIKEITNKGFPITSNMYTDSLLCLANGMRQKGILDFEKNVNIRLAWHFVSDMKDKGLQVTTDTLNSIMSIYAAGGEKLHHHTISMLEQFSRFNCCPNTRTWEILLESFSNDPSRFFILFDHLKSCPSDQLVLNAASQSDIVNVSESGTSSISAASTESTKLSERIYILALDMAIESRSSKRTVSVLESMLDRRIFPLPAQAEKLAKVGRKIVQIHQVIGKLVAAQRDQIHERMVKDNALIQLNIEEYKTRLAAVEGKTMDDSTIENQVKDAYYKKLGPSVNRPRLTKSEHLQVMKKGGEMHARRIDKPRHNILAE
jgi:hypothetical protein